MCGELFIVSAKSCIVGYGDQMTKFDHFGTVFKGCVYYCFFSRPLVLQSYY